MDFIFELKEMNLITYILKLFIISTCSYYMTFKIINIKEEHIFNMIIQAIKILVISIVCTIIKYYINFPSSIIILIVLLSVLMSRNINKSIGYTMLVITISLSINYVIFALAIIISFFPIIIINIQNELISFIVIQLIYLFMWKLFLQIKKFKKGFAFLQKNVDNEYFDIPILNISTVALMGIIIVSEYTEGFSRKFMFVLIALGIIMFITIQKSLQLYYKQKLLVKELDETKDKLANKTDEVKNLEEEILSFSKRSHTIAHKQKSLEYKIEQLMLKAETAGEIGVSKNELKERISNLSKDVYQDKVTVELDKTEIEQIDDMLKYMQSECKKNKIDFELQIKGNIHYMTNNLITKEDLETLLADHIKNAIIAINHTENINRSILVRLGEIDGIYSLYIYDSGIEFEKETLENLGKKPSTTHANEGGTGMGFMNTFDTLRKSNASLIIEEFGEPNKDNYTKAIIIKFDKKNDFKIISYKEKIKAL